MLSYWLFSRKTSLPSLLDFILIIVCTLLNLLKCFTGYSPNSNSQMKLYKKDQLDLRICESALVNGYN